MKFYSTLKIFALVISVAQVGYSMEKTDMDKASCAHLLICAEPMVHEYDEGRDSYFFQYDINNKDNFLKQLSELANYASQQGDSVFYHCPEIKTLDTRLKDKFITLETKEARQNPSETRKKVESPLNFPWCSSGKLRMHFLVNETGDNLVSVYGGTGILIAPDVVLTAAHNLFDTKTQSFPFAVEFLQGINGRPQNVDQNGHMTHSHGAVAKKIVIHTDFKEHGKEVWDIGLIHLEKKLNSPANLASVSKELLDSVYFTAGYPGDLGYWYMYQDNSVDKVVAEIKGALLTHYMDTNKGQSGSGLFVVDEPNQNLSLFAVHVSGEEFKGNTAVLINDEKKTKIEQWIAVLNSEKK